jgi:hypothetical protein
MSAITIIYLNTMRRTFLTIILSVFIAALTYLPFAVNYLLLQPATVMAQGDITPPGPRNGDVTPSGPRNGDVTPSGPRNGDVSPSTNCDPNTQLCNPLLSKYDTLCKVLTGILDLITQVGAIIAVILIIWSGFQFIVAQGNPAKLTAAKKSFMTTILGTAVLLGASVIAEIVVKTIFEITNKNNAGVC